MNLPRVIGLSGPMGSGKSTVAQILEAEYGYVRIKFSQPIKDMAKVLGLTQDHLEGPLKELPSGIICGRTPRYLLQTLGTEWGRDLIGPDIWVNAWSNLAQRQPKVVAEDVRFANEAGAIRALGGEVWRLDRGQMGHNSRPGDPHLHPSELQDFPVDWNIPNNGSLSHLERLVKGLMSINPL